MGTPVVFVHGLWLHAGSWGAWVDLFRERGYEPITPGWPGEMATVHETRLNAGALGGIGVDDVVAHYAKIIAGLPQKPIAIGHSFGGLVVQRLLGDDLVAGAVAIDPAPIKGIKSLPVSALKVASPVLRKPGKRKRAHALTPAQFRYAFGNAISEEESRELYDRWSIPSPGKPLFEAAFANLSRRSPTKVNTANASRGPLLVTAGGADRTVPPAISKATVRQYRHSTAITDLKEFPGKGHSLALDSGWREVADPVLAWLEERSL